LINSRNQDHLTESSVEREKEKRQKEEEEEEEDEETQSNETGERHLLHREDVHIAR